MAWAKEEHIIEMAEVHFKVPFCILSLLPTKPSFMLVCGLQHCYADPRVSSNVTVEIWKEHLNIWQFLILQIVLL